MGVEALELKMGWLRLKRSEPAIEKIKNSHNRRVYLRTRLSAGENEVQHAQHRVCSFRFCSGFGADAHSSFIFHVRKVEKKPRKTNWSRRRNPKDMTKPEFESTVKQDGTGRQMQGMYQ